MSINILRAEYVELTGDTIAALILNQMVYWTTEYQQIDKFLDTEAQARFGVETGHVARSMVTSGWSRRTVAEIRKQCLLTISDTVVRRHITDLVKLGLIEERKNPVNKFDQVLQYRVNFDGLFSQLAEHGIFDISTPMGSIRRLNTSPKSAPSILQNGDCTISKSEIVPNKKIKEEYTTGVAAVGSDHSEEIDVPVLRLDTVPESPKPKKRATKPRDERLDHWAVIAYRDIAHYTPNEAARALLVKEFGDQPEQPLWRAIITEWLSSGWRPQNVNGMLNLYKERKAKTRANLLEKEKLTTPIPQAPPVARRVVGAASYLSDEQQRAIQAARTQLRNAANAVMPLDVGLTAAEIAAVENIDDLAF